MDDKQNPNAEAEPKTKKVLSRGVVIALFAFLLLAVFMAFTFINIVDGTSKATDKEQNDSIAAVRGDLTALKDSMAKDISNLYSGCAQIIDSLEAHRTAITKNSKAISGAYGKINKLEKQNQVLLIQFQQLKDSVTKVVVVKPVVKKTVNRSSLLLDEEDKEDEGDDDY